MEPNQLGTDSTIYSPIESRRHKRSEFEVDVQIHSLRTGRIPGRAVDISESGIAAIVAAELLIGEVVELSAQLRFGPLNIRAIVRNKNFFRYGFEFVDPGAALEQVLLSNGPIY